MRRRSAAHVGRLTARRVLPVELDLPGGRRIQPDQQARHRALAAARLAHQRPGLAAFDGEVDTVDRLHELARLALEHAVEPGRRDVEVFQPGRCTSAPGIAVSEDGARSSHHPAVVQPAGRRVAPAGIRSGRSCGSAP
jgi:hypothetical protein